MAVTGVVAGLLEAVTCSMEGEAVQSGPAGATVQVNVAVPENVGDGVKFAPYVAGWPGCTVAVVGPEGATVRGGVAATASPVSATVGMPPFVLILTVAVRCPAACG